jgi:uncharacterized protein (DUF58 family)
MTRPTARGGALLAVAGATYAAARVLGTWELYLIALAFAGMTAVAWAAVYAGSRRLRVEREAMPEGPVAGEPLTLAFRVRDGGRLPGLTMALEGATGDLGGESERVAVGGPAAGRTGPWPARRGVHRLPAFTAVVVDPLGLARARRPAGEPLDLTVVPRLDELRSCAPCTAAGTRHGGGPRRLPARDAWEFRGIRPHDPGEPLSRVDWKSTAKTGSLMLREMETAADDELTVLLDGSGARGPEETAEDAFETAVRAAGSMAAFALRSGHPVTLVLRERGWRPLLLTADMAGRRRLLHALAVTEPGAVRLGPSLHAIAGGRGHPRRGLLAVVVLRLDQELVSALGRLRNQGASVSVVHVGCGESAEEAERDRLVAALTVAGVRYVRLERDDDVRAALEVGRARRPAAVR